MRRRQRLTDVVGGQWTLQTAKLVGGVSQIDAQLRCIVHEASVNSNVCNSLLLLLQSVLMLVVV
jgi:hypothetical protein